MPSSLAAAPVASAAPAFHYSAAFGGDPSLVERHRADVAAAAARTTARRAALFAAGRVVCPWCSGVVTDTAEAVILGADGLHAGCAAEFYAANPMRPEHTVTARCTRCGEPEPEGPACSACAAAMFVSGRASAAEAADLLIPAGALERQAA